MGPGNGQIFFLYMPIVDSGIGQICVMLRHCGSWNLPGLFLGKPSVGPGIDQICFMLRHCGSWNLPGLFLGKPSWNLVLTRSDS